MILVFVIKVLSLLIILLLLVAFARTVQTKRDKNQSIFTSGKVPVPEGLYRGTVPGHTVAWKGKKFDPAGASGINIFDDHKGSTYERYPFKTSTGKGTQDEEINVLKIDYDIPENPFWVRPILDEIVEVAPQKYLGKIHLRVIPGYPFSLGYFELQR